MSSEPILPAGVTAAAKVAWLSGPTAYPERPRTVQCIETHFAWLFLTETRAFKLKKALRLHGADLRSLAERERCCREELRLNRRLARQTYLGVVPLVAHEARLALGGPGVVVDWLVEMKRLDLSAMLDVRLCAGTVTHADLEGIVRHLLQLDTGPRQGSEDFPGGNRAVLTPDAFVASVAFRLDEARAEIARPEFGIAASAREPVAAALRARFIEVGTLLERRAGRVREGHGDLRAEHVCLGPPLQIIDALEFDRRLRMLDPAEDVAMLAIDVERLDGQWVRAGLCAAYAALARDDVPAPLWGFYLALRAATRAKVALWHLDDPDDAQDPAHWQARALAYLALGQEMLANGQPARRGGA